MGERKAVTAPTADEFGRNSEESGPKAMPLTISAHAHAAKYEEFVLFAEADNTQNRAINLGQNDGVRGLSRTRTALLALVEPRDRLVFVRLRDPHDRFGHEVRLT